MTASLSLPIILLVVPVCSTLAGGVLALQFRRSLGVLTAAGAGLLLGAAFLDLLPEALSMGAAGEVRPADVLGVVLLSFMFFLGVQSVLDAAAARWEGSLRALGKVGGVLLIFHSLRDGMAIGLAYAASHAAGYAVAGGIAAHDLGDGMNTVLLTTRGAEARRSDYWFLAADALAPLVGGLLTVWWTFSLRSSAMLLAVAAGFFLQMATSDFLPAVRRDDGSRLVLLPAVMVGAAVIYGANVLTGLGR